MQRERPARCVYVPSSPTQAPLAFRGRRRLLCERVAGTLRRGVPPAIVGSEKLQAVDCDHAAHGYAAAIAAVKLQSSNEPCIGQALQPPLGGGDGTSRVETAVNLAGEEMSEACN